jgi:hypothetical protein
MWWAREELTSDFFRVRSNAESSSCSSAVLKIVKVYREMPDQRPSAGGIGGHCSSLSPGKIPGPYGRRLLPVCCPHAIAGLELIRAKDDVVATSAVTLAARRWARAAGLAW